MSDLKLKTATQLIQSLDKGCRTFILKKSFPELSEEEYKQAQLQYLRGNNGGEDIMLFIGDKGNKLCVASLKEKIISAYDSLPLVIKICIGLED